MYAIEFETTVQNHVIRIPDSIPNGTAIRVLVLMNDSQINKETNQNNSFFEQLCLDNETTDDDLALLFERDKDTGRDIAL